MLTPIRFHHDLLVRQAALRLEKFLDALVILLHGDAELIAKILHWIGAFHVSSGHNFCEGVQDTARVVRVFGAAHLVRHEGPFRHLPLHARLYRIVVLSAGSFELPDASALSSGVFDFRIQVFDRRRLLPPT